MDLDEYMGYCPVNNVVRDHLQEDSLIATFTSNYKLKKVTRLLNKELRKIVGKQSYSKFVQCKKKILRGIIEDIEVSGDSDLSDDDYDTFYKSIDYSKIKSSKIHHGNDCLMWQFISKEPKFLASKLKGDVKSKIYKKEKLTNISSTKKSNKVSNSKIADNLKLQSAKKNLTPKLNDIYSKTLDYCQDDWPDNVSFSDLQAHSTKIFSDINFETPKKKSKSTSKSPNLLNHLTVPVIDDYNSNKKSPSKENKKKNSKSLSKENIYILNNDTNLDGNVDLENKKKITNSSSEILNKQNESDNEFFELSLNNNESSDNEDFYVQNQKEVSTDKNVLINDTESHSLERNISKTVIDQDIINGLTDNQSPVLNAQEIVHISKDKNVSLNVNQNHEIVESESVNKDSSEEIESEKEFDDFLTETNNSKNKSPQIDSVFENICKESSKIINKNIQEVDKNFKTQLNNLASQEMFSSIEDLAEDSHTPDGLDKQSKENNTKSLKISSISCQDKQNQRKVTEIQHLVEKEDLLDDNSELTFSISNILDDEEIFIIDMPKNVFDSNLINQKLSFLNKTLSIGQNDYEAFHRPISTTYSCVLKSEKERNFKIQTIKPVLSIVTRRKKLINKTNKELKKAKKSKKLFAELESEIDIPESAVNKNENINKYKFENLDDDAMAKNIKHPYVIMLSKIKKKNKDELEVEKEGSVNNDRKTISPLKQLFESTQIAPDKKKMKKCETKNNLEPDLNSIDPGRSSSVHDEQPFETTESLPNTKNKEQENFKNDIDSQEVSPKTNVTSSIKKLNSVVDHTFDEDSTDQKQIIEKKIPKKSLSLKKRVQDFNVDGRKLEKNSPEKKETKKCEIKNSVSVRNSGNEKFSNDPALLDVQNSNFSSLELTGSFTATLKKTIEPTKKVPKSLNKKSDSKNLNQVTSISKNSLNPKRSKSIFSIKNFVLKKRSKDVIKNKLEKSNSNKTETLLITADKRLPKKINGLCIKQDQSILKKLNSPVKKMCVQSKKVMDKSAVNTVKNGTDKKLLTPVSNVNLENLSNASHREKENSALYIEDKTLKMNNSCKEKKIKKNLKSSKENKVSSIKKGNNIEKKTIEPNVNKSNNQLYLEKIQSSPETKKLKKNKKLSGSHEVIEPLSAKKNLSESDLKVVENPKSIFVNQETKKEKPIDKSFSTTVKDDSNKKSPKPTEPSSVPDESKENPLNAKNREQGNSTIDIDSQEVSPKTKEALQSVKKLDLLADYSLDTDSEDEKQVAVKKTPRKSLSLKKIHQDPNAGSKKLKKNSPDKKKAKKDDSTDEMNINITKEPSSVENQNAVLSDNQNRRFSDHEFSQEKKKSTNNMKSVDFDDNVPINISQKLKKNLSLKKNNVCTKKIESNKKISANNSVQDLKDEDSSIPSSRSLVKDGDDKRSLKQTESSSFTDRNQENLLGVNLDQKQNSELDIDSQEVSQNTKKALQSVKKLDLLTNFLSDEDSEEEKILRKDVSKKMVATSANIENNQADDFSQDIIESSQPSRKSKKNKKHVDSDENIMQVNIKNVKDKQFLKHVSAEEHNVMNGAKVQSLNEKNKFHETLSEPPKKKKKKNQLLQIKENSTFINETKEKKENLLKKTDQSTLKNTVNEQALESSIQDINIKNHQETSYEKKENSTIDIDSQEVSQKTKETLQSVKKLNLLANFSSDSDSEVEEQVVEKKILQKPLSMKEKLHNLDPKSKKIKKSPAKKKAKKGLNPTLEMKISDTKEVDFAESQTNDNQANSFSEDIQTSQGKKKSKKNKKLAISNENIELVNIKKHKLNSTNPKALEFKSDKKTNLQNKKKLENGTSQTVKRKSPKKLNPKPSVKKNKKEHIALTAQNEMIKLIKNTLNLDKEKLKVPTSDLKRPALDVVISPAKKRKGYVSTSSDSDDSNTERSFRVNVKKTSNKK